MNPLVQTLKKTFGIESKSSLASVLKQARKWMPTNYETHIRERISYMDGEMHDDMLTYLAKEFPRSHHLMERMIVTLPILQHITRKRARVFEGSTFELVDRKSGEQVEPDSDVAKAWARIMDRSQLVMALSRADAIRDQCHAAALKPWWDGDHLMVSCYSPGKVFIDPNPDREWDPYSAKTVSFQRTGAGGIRSEPRYEVWGTRDPDMADDTDRDGRRIYLPTIRYIASENDQERKPTDDDDNPLIDPQTKRPIVPFVWLTDNHDTIYDQKGHNLVEFNRIVNLALTQLQTHMSWTMLGFPVYRKPAGSDSKLPAIRPMSPAQAVELPTDVELEFVRNDIQVTSITDTYQFLVQWNALMAGIDPAAVKLDSTAPQSGYALKISVSGLQGLIKSIIPLYQPDLQRLLDIMIIMYNYYARFSTGPDKLMLIPDNLQARWKPGELEAGPADLNEMGLRYKQEIDLNVSTPDDYAAERWNLDPSAAKAKVDDNAKRNAELAKQSTRYPSETSPDGLFGAAAATARLARKGKAPGQTDEDKEDAQEGSEDDDQVQSSGEAKERNQGPANEPGTPTKER